MEIDIVNQKDNRVLNRNEVKFVCNYEGEATPKLLDVKNKLIALLNTKKDLIVVDSLQPHFGEAKALGYAKVYDSKDDLEYIETEHVMAKNAQEEEEEVAEETIVEKVEEVAEEVAEKVEEVVEKVEEVVEEAVEAVKEAIEDKTSEE